MSTGAAAAPDPLDPGDVLDTPAAGGMAVRGGVLRVAGFLAGMLVSLIGVVLLTRHLGTADFGRYQTVISVIAIVQSVTDLGMATLGVREYTQRRGVERERLMRVLLGLRVAATAGGTVVAAVVVGALVAFGGQPAELLAGVGLMGAGLIAIVLQSTLQIPLGVELRLTALTVLDLARQGLTAALTVALVLAGAGLVPFFAVGIPVNLVLLYATWRLVRGRISLRPSTDRRQWAALVRPSIVFSLATAVGVVYLYTAQIITAVVTSAEQTGLFSTAFRIYVIVVAIPAVLVSSAFPLIARAARDDQARLANVLHGLLAGTLLLGGAAAVACIVGAAPIVDLVAGADYAAAAPALRILGAALLLSFVIAAAGFTLLALHRHLAMVVANVVALVLSCGTVAVLASSQGARGAALGTLVGEAALLTGYLIALGRGRPDLRPRGAAFLRVAVPLAAALAVALVPGLPDVLAVVAALGVYAVGALLAGAVPDDLINLLPEPARARLSRG